MKRLFAVLLLASIFSASIQSCGPKKEETKEEEKKEETSADEEIAQPETPSATDLIAQGQALADASDCKTCHHQTNKLIGPAHKDVAAKYEFTKANVSLLADKIIQGGAGTWGEIPMAAHPDLSKGDAEKMAMYVLSLDGEQYKE
jgi:cytochrome c